MIVSKKTSVDRSMIFGTVVRWSAQSTPSAAALVASNPSHPVSTISIVSVLESLSPYRTFDRIVRKHCNAVGNRVRQWRRSWEHRAVFAQAMERRRNFIETSPLMGGKDMSGSNGSIRLDQAVFGVHVRSALTSPFAISISLRMTPPMALSGRRWDRTSSISTRTTARPRSPRSSTCPRWMSRASRCRCPA